MPTPARCRRSSGRQWLPLAHPEPVTETLWTPVHWHHRSSGQHAVRRRRCLLQHVARGELFSTYGLAAAVEHPRPGSGNGRGGLPGGASERRIPEISALPKLAEGKVRSPPGFPARKKMREERKRKVFRSQLNGYIVTTEPWLPIA